MTIKEAYQSLKKGLDSKIEDKLKKLQALTSEDGIKTYGSYASELSTQDGKYPGTGGIRTFITGRDKLTYDFIDLDKYYISDEVDQLLSNYYDKEEVDKILEDYCTKEEAEQMNEQTKQDLEAEIINEHNLSVEADENLGKDISQVRSDLSAESDSREEADKKLEELVTEVQGKIIDEHNLSVEADDALRVLIEALQDKLIYFDDHFVCKSNDSEGYLNWDKDAGIYFNDANVGDMWKLVAGEDSVPLCFAVTVDGITYQYCIDMKTGNAYYRYSDVGEGSLADIPWIPVVNTDTNLFVFTDSLPTEDIEENKIYCIPDPDSDETNNLFDEYYYHDGKWELFGKYTLKVSLDDYYTKEETYSKEEVLANFQQKLTAGTGITIEDNVISSTVTGGITSVLASGTSPLTLDASTTDGIVHITGSVDTSNFVTQSDLSGYQEKLKYYSELEGYPQAVIDCIVDSGTFATLGVYTNPTSSNGNKIVMDVASTTSRRTTEQQVLLDPTGFYYNDCEVATKCTLEDYYTKTAAEEKFQEKLNWYTETANSASIGANTVYIDAGTGGVQLTCSERFPFTYNGCEVATQCWVNDAIANIQAGDVDLSGYQKKLKWYEEGDNYAQIADSASSVLFILEYGDKTALLNADNGVVINTALLSYNNCEVATQCWVQDNYYTQTEIDNKLAVIEGGGSVAPCTWIGYGNATFSGVGDGTGTISRNSLYPTSGTPQEGDAILYFHSYQDDPETVSFATVKSVSDNVITYNYLYSFEISGGSTDLSNYYTKSEINNLIGDLSDTYYTKQDTDFYFQKKLNHYTEDTSYGDLSVGAKISGKDDSMTDEDTFVLVGQTSNVASGYDDHYWNTEVFHQISENVRLKAHQESGTAEVSTVQSMYVDFIAWEVHTETTNNELILDNEFLWLKGKKVATQDYVDEAVSSVSGGTTSIDIIDNLTSDRTNAALSANMGRELAEMIDELEEGKQNNLIYYSESAHNGVVIGASNTNVEVTASPFTYNGVEVATVDDLEELKNTLEGEITTAAGGGVTVVNASGTSPLVLDATVEDGTATITGYISSGYYASQTSLDSLASSLSNCITSSTIGNYLDSYLLSSVAQETYQKKLTAGSYISITDDNVINTTYVAGPGILIGSPTTPTIALNVSTEGDSYINLDLTDSDGTQKIISASLTESFLNVINGKQDSLTAGNNISISNNVISAVLDDYITSGNLTDTLKDYVTTEQLNDAIAGVTPGEGDTEVNKVIAVNADTTGVLSFSGTPQIGEVTITASIKESGLIEFINNNIESISIEEIDNLF